MAKYDETTKSAVMAALLEGQSVSSIARDYDIPKGTVSSWKKTALAGVGEKATQKDTSIIGDLLIELLEKNIRSLIAMSEVAADKEWLKGQDAAEFGTMFGIKHDKAVRLIEALNQSDAEGP